MSSLKGQEVRTVRQCMDADNLHRRLKKIIGQVQAIDRMIDEDIPCEDILAQINAAKSALHKAGQVVLEGHIKLCPGWPGARRPGPDHRQLHQSGGAVCEYELTTNSVKTGWNLSSRFSCFVLTRYTPMGIMEIP